MSTESGPTHVTRVCPGCRRKVEGEGALYCPHDGLPLIERSSILSSVGERTPVGPADAEVEIAPGMMIGDYKVDGVVGGGGMGVIYAAVHPVIRKRVAIKVLNRRYAMDPQAVSRFVMEARAVNEIGHYNIVDIFSIGELDDGRNYFVMEHLEGLSLHAILRKVGRLKPGEALPVFEQLCDALSAAHGKGFVHRDLKPDNIIVLKRPPRPFIKILDFGLAKLRGAYVGHETAIGTVLGTPEYMAPEQCRGEEVDERSDVYAVGVLLYELLTGRKPFTHASALKVLQMQQRDPPVSPASLTPLSPALERVILTALAKDPADRFRTAQDLFTRLREAVPETLPWTIDLERSPSRRPGEDTLPPDGDRDDVEPDTVRVDAQAFRAARSGGTGEAEGDKLADTAPSIPSLPDLPAWAEEDVRVAPLKAAVAPAPGASAPLSPAPAFASGVGLGFEAGPDEESPAPRVGAAGAGGREQPPPTARRPLLPVGSDDLTPAPQPPPLLPVGSSDLTPAPRFPPSHSVGSGEVMAGSELASLLAVEAETPPRDPGAPVFSVEVETPTPAVWPLPESRATALAPGPPARGAAASAAPARGATVPPPVPPDLEFARTLPMERPDFGSGSAPSLSALASQVVATDDGVTFEPGGASTENGRAQPPLLMRADSLATMVPPPEKGSRRAAVLWIIVAAVGAAVSVGLALLLR